MKSSSSAKNRHLFLSAITLLSVLCYLPSVLGWYVSPQKVPLFSVASLGFAYLWPWLLLLAIVWFWIKRKIALALLLLLVMGLPPIRVSFSIGGQKDFTIEKSNKSLRVMQWNCQGLPGVVKNWPLQKEQRMAAVRFIQQYQPDIICIQDLREDKGSQLFSNISLLADSLGYTYYEFASYPPVVRRYGKVYDAVAIFSKRKLIAQGQTEYPGDGFPGFIAWADLQLDGHTIRVVTTHFTSIQLNSHHLYKNARLPYYLKPDSAMIMSTSRMKKLLYFPQMHARQVLFLRSFMDTCQVPVVLAADLNTIPANYIYRQLKGNLVDGFLGSKTGFGNTYNYLAPHLRIDYLMHHPTLEAVQWKHFTKGFWDHDHLLADYSWKPVK